jgi:ATP-dependent helicase/nuclease subunit B
MNAALIPAAADLIDEVASLMDGRGQDLSDVLVVFPGKRPAHFLRRRLARAIGTGFIPPRILSMDELVHSIFDERTGAAAALMEDIDAVALLHEIQLAAPRPIGGSGFMSLDSFFPLGVKIFQDLEELTIEGVEGRKVAEVQPLIEAEVPARSRDRLRELARFYQEFYPLAQKKGLSTRSSRYASVCRTIESGDLKGFTLVILAGFYSLTAAEKALFQRVGGWPGSQFIFQDGPGMKEKLSGLGIACNPAPEESSRPEVRFFSSPDAHGQVFALGAALPPPDEGTAVILPAPETLFPLLRHCLSRFPEEDYNVSLGYPLDRTPLYGFFQNLMTLIGSMDEERVYIPDYLTFVLHPYTKNIRHRGSAETTRVLFHAIEDRLAASRTMSFASLEEIESDAKLMRAAAASLGGEPGSPTAEELAAHLADIHDRTVRRFRSFPTVKEFASRCIELIAWISESSTAPVHPFFSQFSEEFVRSLETISRSLIADKSFSDSTGYFILFRRYLSTRYHPFPGTPLRGLQVLGALETRCLRFQRVFVLDANEGSLPASGAEGTLLPLAVRAALGLPTYRDRDEIAAYHFHVLSRGARELSLFSVESGERERSRFAERLLWEREREAGSVDAGAVVRPIQYSVSLQERAPEAVTKTAEVAAWLRGRELSATALDAYLRCPLSFYYRHVLGLGRRESPSGEIEQADIGLFVHEALLRYFDSRKGRQLTPADADRPAMDSLVEKLFRERFGDGQSGAARLLKKQLSSHLGDFISGYFAHLVRDHRITLDELEKRAASTRDGFQITGRLDAIQQRDGLRWIVDYKSSSNPKTHRIRFDRLDPADRETWSAAIPTLQLPFYLMLEPRAENAMFLLLGRPVLDQGIEVPLFADAGEARRRMPELEEVILALMREIVSPEVPFLPAANGKRACSYCDFQVLCGMQRV